MTLNNKVVARLVNKALEVHNVTIEDLWSNEGKVTVGKKDKWWWDVYEWPNEAAYSTWKDWCIQQLQKAYPDNDPEELFNELDTCCSPAQHYLFRKQTSLL